MIISGGFIDCVLNATGNDINGNSYSDYSHHRWTITGSSGPIAGSNAMNGTPVQATWQLITGYGHHDSSTPGNGISWTRNGGPLSAPLVAYLSGNMVQLQRFGTANSVMNGFKCQGSGTTTYSNADEIGLVGLMGPGTIGLEWSSSLQASSFSSPFVIVHLPIFRRGGSIGQIAFPWNVGVTDTTLNDIKNWFYQDPGTPASAWWRWTIDF
jgi:hypothetical protein